MLSDVGSCRKLPLIGSRSSQDVIAPTIPFTPVSFGGMNMRSTPSPIKLSLARPELGSNPASLSTPSAPPHRGLRANTQKKKLPRALVRRPRTAIPQNKTIVYGRALASAGEDPADILLVDEANPEFSDTRLETHAH